MVQRYYRREELDELSLSVRDGLSVKKTRKLRCGGIRLIQGACKELRLPQWIAATGAHLFHRFFAERSMLKNDRFVVAMAAMFLATKVQDRPKSIRDVIRACYVRRFGVPSQQFDHLNVVAFMELNKEAVLEAERVILMMTAFDFEIQLPNTSAAHFLRAIPWESLEHRKADVFHLVWKFLEDSWTSTICMQFSPPAIALGLITLAGKHLGVPMEIGDLWDQTMEGEVVEPIIHEQIVQLYVKGEGGMWTVQAQDLQSQRIVNDASPLGENGRSGGRSSFNSRRLGGGSQPWENGDLGAGNGEADRLSAESGEMGSEGSSIMDDDGDMDQTLVSGRDDRSGPGIASASGSRSTPSVSSSGDNRSEAGGVDVEGVSSSSGLRSKSDSDTGEGVETTELCVNRDMGGIVINPGVSGANLPRQGGEFGDRESPGRSDAENTQG
ncbi:hypothetical protein BSKO_04868 [Bryopsis sp. KO-2023]|nr:hypothetical protein BSKO_04868 [Bryopsis sp. KO-2023]